MAWQISGEMMEFCNCRMMCPCWFGPEGEPDNTWCASAFGFTIANGQSDGVDLGGAKVAMAAEWPGNFFAGNGTARVYLDNRASDAQRRELAAIFGGQKGGMFAAVFGGVVSKWLPAQTVAINMASAATTSLSVGDVGKAELKPLQNGAGKPTNVTGSVAQGALQVEGMQLASAKGSRWADPQMRAWEADSGTLHSFAWNG
jgi:hypothetical protein